MPASNLHQIPGYIDPDQGSVNSATALSVRHLPERSMDIEPSDFIVGLLMLVFGIDSNEHFSTGFRQPDTLSLAFQLELNRGQACPRFVIGSLQMAAREARAPVIVVAALAGAVPIAKGLPLDAALRGSKSNSFPRVVKWKGSGCILKTDCGTQ